MRIMFAALVVLVALSSHMVPIVSAQETGPRIIVVVEPQHNKLWDVIASKNPEIKACARVSQVFENEMDDYELIATQNKYLPFNELMRIAGTSLDYEHTCWLKGMTITSALLEVHSARFHFYRNASQDALGAAF